MSLEENNKCKFHKIELNDDGTDTQNKCLFVNNIVDCDGESVEHLQKCPLWGKLA